MSETAPAAPAPAEASAPAAETTPATAAPAEPKAVETKAPESKKDTDKAVGSRFAALSRKEREVLNAQKAAKAQAEALAKKEAELAAREAKVSKKPANPIEALEAAGFTYEQAAAFMLNGKEVPVDQKVADLQKRLDDAEAVRAKEAQERVENEKKAAEAAKEQSMQQWRASVADEVKKGAEKWEYLNWSQRYDLVTSVIEEHYNLTAEKGEPKIMSTEEAADKVEAWLEQQTAAEFQKLSALKKFQAKVKPPSEKTPDGVSSSDDEMNQIVQGVKHARTLTNAHKPSPAVTPKKLTEKERFEMAMKALDNLGS